jgi:hypothetical protein
MDYYENDPICCFFHIETFKMNLKLILPLNYTVSFILELLFDLL